MLIMKSRLKSFAVSSAGQWLLVVVMAFAAGCQPAGKRVDPSVPDGGAGEGLAGPAPLSREETALFSCSDSALMAAYRWARSQALAYVHDGGDSVGLWYEAALPRREAFCMRDVSHQVTGAAVLGLNGHNYNMMHRFAENISESKDWCSYWEINRYNRPAPVDYANDREFWYNLNANLDVLQACLKLYQWTADERYLSDEAFAHFYQATLENYVPHWQLDVEHVMDRPRYMHTPEPFDAGNGFHVCRGLASYVENFPGIVVGLDLLATLYAGHDAYAQMLALRGDADGAALYHTRAEAYRRLIDDRWWDDGEGRYHTFWTENKEFHRGEGVPFMLWFQATADVQRVQASVQDILSAEWNVENLSYFPMLLYRLGYDEEAYRYLMALPANSRRAYPEASYGWMEGLAGGYMGLAPEAGTRTVRTLMHGPATDTATLANVPVWGGTLTVQHEGHTATTLTNHTGGTLTWQATFYGRHNRLRADGRRVASGALTTGTDVKGNDYTTATLSVPEGETMTVRCAD